MTENTTINTSTSEEKDVAKDSFKEIPPKEMPLIETAISKYKVNGEVPLTNVYTNEGYPNVNFLDLAVARNIKPYDENGVHIGLAGAVVIKHSEKLDPTTINNSIGSLGCSNQNLCVPVVNVPDITKRLAEDLKYEDGKLITPLDELTSKEVKDLADKIAELKDYTIPDWITTEDLVPELTSLVQPLNLEEYSKLNTNAQINLTTQDSVPCRPETEATIPELDKTNLNNPDVQDMLKKLEDLLSIDTEPKEQVVEPDVSMITSREEGGHGAFDWFAKATLNQIEYGINHQLWSKAEAREIYASSLGAMMEHAVQFALTKEQSKWQSLLVRNQMIQANVQALLAKAELIMMPTKVKLAYAQLEAQLKQIDLLNYQIEVEKQKLPQVVAQTDQIREQTSLICQQRKLAVEQLAQSEFDRKLKQEQVTNSQLENQIKAEQITQSKQATKQMVAQTEQTVEQTKLIHAQGLGALKDIKLKDSQLLQAQAQLKLQAQQLLKEKEQIALTKAQTASTYSTITMLAEQVKTLKAQYSDTIDGEELGGILGAQMKVNKAQAIGFERQAFNSLLSQLQSGWITKKTADMATLSPNSFTALGLDRAINWYVQKYFGMPNDIFALPANYTDYISDEQMDGKVPVNTGSNAVKQDKE